MFPDGVWKYEEQALKYEEKGNPLIVVMLFDTVRLFVTVRFGVFMDGCVGIIKFITIKSFIASVSPL